MTFEQQEGGRFLGVVSAKALAWADGSPDRIVSVSFARFLRERDIDFHWRPEQPTHFAVSDTALGVRADTGTNADTYTVQEAEEPTTLIGRFIRPNLVLLIGLTACLRGKKHWRASEAVPIHDCLSFPDSLWWHPVFRRNGA